MSQLDIAKCLDESRRYPEDRRKVAVATGFRTQIWVTKSHGPAPLLVGSMVREFCDETHVPAPEPTVGFWHSDPKAHGYSTANLPEECSRKGRSGPNRAGSR